MQWFVDLNNIEMIKSDKSMKMVKKNIRNMMVKSQKEKKIDCIFLRWKYFGSIIADDINALNAMKACTILYIPYSEYGE